MATCANTVARNFDSSDEEADFEGFDEEEIFIIDGKVIGTVTCENYYPPDDPEMPADVADGGSD